MEGTRIDPATDEAGASGEGSDRYQGWSAILNLEPIVSETPLRVGGRYHLDQRCGGVTLQVKVPQGINPDILLLDLVEGPGIGGDWIDVEGEFPAREGQYESVTVIDSDGESVSMKVEEIH
ncbi:MAG TPA: hypothetical protein VF577_01905 [Allosphingosinicella sp.]